GSASQYYPGSSHDCHYLYGRSWFWGHECIWRNGNFDPAYGSSGERGVAVYARICYFFYLYAQSICPIDWYLSLAQFRCQNSSGYCSTTYRYIFAYFAEDSSKGRI